MTADAEFLSYSQRADEIAKLDPKVAYYCRLYAVQQVHFVSICDATAAFFLEEGDDCLPGGFEVKCVQGIALENRAPEVNGVLEALMERLEKDKPMVQVHPVEDGQYCEQFAMVVFNRADKADRAGKADKNTVKAFYVASVFIDVRQQLCFLANFLKLLLLCFAYVYRPPCSQNNVSAGIMICTRCRSCDSSAQTVSCPLIWQRGSSTRPGRRQTSARPSGKGARPQLGLRSRMTTWTCQACQVTPSRPA